MPKTLQTNPLFGLFDEVVDAVMEKPPSVLTRISKGKGLKLAKPICSTDTCDLPQSHEKDRSSI